MTPRAPTPAPVPHTLAEQKADFTAEGSPPPGKVATTPPLTDSTPVVGKSEPEAKPQPKHKPEPKHKPKHKQAG